ncbi:hypothetical protein YTPLAS18_30540 [Nitrospira sp.]|nr:hypothetical protein YTPLAS18_30540 [Nitrospira sp.]
MTGSGGSIETRPSLASGRDYEGTLQAIRYGVVDRRGMGISISTFSLGNLV